MTSDCLIAITSAWEIFSLFFDVRSTWLFIFASLVSLASFTSPALYLPDEMSWNCWREMLTLVRSTEAMAGLLEELRVNS